MTDCQDARRQKDLAVAALAAAEADWHAANRDRADNQGPDGDDGIEFVGCLITGGAISFANPVLGIGIGTTCAILVGRHMQKEQLAKERADDRLRQALKNMDRALKDLDDAEWRVDTDCPVAEGCGSRGGPGYRRPSGKCAGWDDWGSSLHNSGTAYA